MVTPGLAFSERDLRVGLLDAHGRAGAAVDMATCGNRANAAPHRARRRAANLSSPLNLAVPTDPAPAAESRQA